MSEDKDKTTETKLDNLEEQIKKLTELITSKKSKLGRKKGQGKGRPTKTKETILNSQIIFYLMDTDKKLFFDICDQIQTAPSEILRDYVIEFNRKNMKILTEDTAPNSPTDTAQPSDADGTDGEGNLL